MESHLRALICLARVKRAAATVMIPQEQPQKFSTPEITAREGDQLPSGDTELDNFVHTLQAHLNALQ